MLIYLTETVQNCLKCKIYLIVFLFYWQLRFIYLFMYLFIYLFIYLIISKMILLENCIITIVNIFKQMLFVNYHLEISYAITKQYNFQKLYFLREVVSVF